MQWVVRAAWVAAKEPLSGVGGAGRGEAVGVLRGGNALPVVEVEATFTNVPLATMGFWSIARTWVENSVETANA
jgi:hypothetical protein